MKIATGLLSALLMVAVGCGTESKKDDSADAQASTDQAQDQAQDQADDKAPVDQKQGDKAPVDPKQDDKAPVDQGDKAPDQASDKAPDQADDKADQDEPKQDEPKQDEPKQDEPKQDEPKQDEPKQDQSKDEPKQDDSKQSDQAGQQSDEQRVQALIDEHGRDGFMTYLEGRFTTIESNIADLSSEDAQVVKEKIAAGRASLEELRSAADEALLEKATMLVKEIEKLEAAIAAARS